MADKITTVKYKLRYFPYSYKVIVKNAIVSSVDQYIIWQTAWHVV